MPRRKASPIPDPLIELLGDQPIAYHPLLAKVLRSVTAAVFLSQLLYWHGRGHYGDWTYKSFSDFYNETGLTRRQQDTARRILRSQKLLEEELHGSPPTRYFRVLVDNLSKLLTNSNLYETYKLNCTKRTNRIVRNGQIDLYETGKSICAERTKLHTEITTETTTKITTGGGIPHPAIEIYKSVKGTYPHSSQWSKIADTIGETQPLLDLWQQIIVAYIGRGWNPDNITGMLDYFSRREIPGDKNVNQSSDNRLDNELRAIASGLSE